MRSLKKRAPRSAKRSVKSGNDRDRKVYSKRDVEVLVAMALAGAQLARRKGWKAGKRPALRRSGDA